MRTITPTISVASVMAADALYEYVGTSARLSARLRTTPTAVSGIRRCWSPRAMSVHERSIPTNENGSESARIRSGTTDGA